MGTVKLRPDQGPDRGEVMQGSTKASIGVGAATWVAGQVGEARAYDRAGRIMNAQIEADIDYIARHGRVADVPPALPLTGRAARSKPVLFLQSWLMGAALTAVLVALPFLVTGLSAHDPNTPPGLAIVGSLGVGLGGALLAGWLPGLLIWIVRGMRENNRRSEGVVLAEFRRYWEARQQAAHDLMRGADPVQVNLWLGSFFIPVAEDD